MAGFAIDIGDQGVAIESPVQAPSATTLGVAAKGLENLGRGVFGVLDAQARAARADKPSEGAISRQLYGGLSQQLDGLKGMDPLQTRTGVQSALTAYTNAGGKVDSSVSELIKLKTGIDVSYLNYDPEQEAINGTVKFMQENPGYLYKARSDLRASGQDFTESDVLRNAMLDVQALQANEATIAAAAAGAQVDFNSVLRPQIDTSLTKIRQLAFSALAVEQQANQDISPESLMRLRSEFEKLKATYTKPSYVTAEQWQGVQAQIDTLGQFLTTIENYDQEVLRRKNLDALEPIWGALQKQAGELATTDPLLAKALLDTKLDLSAYLATKTPDILKIASNLPAEATVYKELDFSIFEQGRAEAAFVKTDGSVEASPGDSAVPIDSLHDPDEITKAEDFGDVERSDVVHFAVTDRINLSVEKGVERPEQRDNFLAGIGQATAAISTSPTLMRQTVFSEILNQEVLGKLKIVEQYDPQGAELARARLADAIKAQANVAVTSIVGSLADSGFRIAGVGKVEFDLDTLRLDAGEKAVVTTFASKWYDGDVTAMIADRGRRLPAFDRGQVEAAGLKLNSTYQQYRKTSRPAQVLKFYSDSLRKIGVDPKDFETMMIQQVTPKPEGTARGTLDNPWNINWSEDTNADEKFFASIRVGDYFVNRDGAIEQKVK